MLNDLMYALRSLRHSPGFAAIAVLTVALGIGASAAVFSVVNAVLLRPLPYSEADRLVVVWGDLLARDVRNFAFSPPDFADVRERVTLLEDVAAVNTFQQALTGDDGEPEQVRVAGVTHNFPRLLGATVILGRDLEADDAVPVAPQAPGAAPAPPPPAAGLLSYGFWQRRYGGDPDVVGRLVNLGNQRMEIVGVLAPGFEILFAPGSNIERDPDIIAALRLDFVTASRINVFLRVVGRVRPGVALAAVQEQLDGLAADLRAEHTIKAAANWHFRVESLHADLTAGVRPTMIVLMGAVLLVLLIACANVANLLLVRGAARVRDLSVRAALGSSRWQLVRHGLAESMVLAAGGALLGVLLAAAGIRLLVLLQPQDLPRLATISIDPVVLGFAAGMSMLAALLFGVVPAVRASRADIAGALRAGGRSAGLSRGAALRHGVIIVEVALCFVLLIASGLMLRSFTVLHRTDPGFETDGVLTFFAAARGQQPQQRAAFKKEMVQRIGALPGVVGVTAANPLPMDGGIANTRWGTSAALDDPDLFQQANLHFVLPGYFETLKTRLIAGRAFEESDNAQESAAIVIDDRIARAAFGNATAAGERLLVRYRSNEPEWADVIGVVAHQKHGELHRDGLPGIFITDGQVGHAAANRWAVRVSGDPGQAVSRIREEIAAIDPLVPMAEVRPMTDLLDRARAPARFALILMCTFAAVAATLAAIGLYGVLATAVRQRTAEIGLRMAFGAPPRRILALFVGQGLRLWALGIAAGVLGALASARLLENMLFGVPAMDPLTYVLGAIFFAVIAVMASWLPARRAQQLQPTIALRRDVT